MENIRIALVDDQLLFRQGIAALISNTAGLELFIEADNGISCLEQLEQQTILPHIALVDIEMPGMDGIELNERIQSLYPTIKVIILSVHARERLIARMIQAGASGYLIKNCGKEELMNAIHTTHKNGFYINMQVLKAMQESSSKNAAIKTGNGIAVEISPREKEVIQLICKEYSNSEIAEQLFISIRTAEGHRNNLLAKTGSKNTAGLVLFAVKNHFIDISF